jgi:glycosyltransferase involved in cell wall biosynthesis
MMHMTIQQHGNGCDVLSQENEHNISADAYPVDLSLFLNLSQMQTASALEEDDPIVVAQYALACWNSYVANGEGQSKKAFLGAALWLVGRARHLGSDAIGWPLTYAHPLYCTKGSWLSAVAQGGGLSVLVRAYQLTGDRLFLKTANRAARTFELDILDGGVCTPVGAGGLFFEEAAVYPAAHTLHGCVFALLGLCDYVSITGNPHTQRSIEQGEATLHSVFDEFDLGFWTRADLLRRDLATPTELAQQTALLRALAGCRKCLHCEERALLWQRYQRNPLLRLRYAGASTKALLKKLLLRRVRAVILTASRMANPQLVPRLRICVPVSDYPSPGGVRTFLDRTAHVMADKWRMEYLTQDIRPGAGERVMHQFGKAWMRPWYFPQVWLYTLAGLCKLLSQMRQGANYGLIIPQDSVFSGAFAALVGKLTGVRVVCFDHSTLTWYRSRSFRAERMRHLDEKAWLWLFRQLVRLALAFYWPSLYILARLATVQANQLLSPGVYGDELDEIYRELHIPASRVTRFNQTIDMQRHPDLSVGERAARRASMDIPTDALVIAMNVRLDVEKGLDISLESISRALSALPTALRRRVHVIIAGDGQLRGWLEKEILQRGPGFVCRMMGHISNEEVYSLLAVSDISLHTSTRCACMPMAMLEGMAAGCAVVASNVPLANVHMLAEERGIVVPAGDVELTSKALERLLGDSQLRDRMGKAAREYIALHHSAEAFRRMLLRVSYWSDLDQLPGEPNEPLEASK